MDRASASGAEGRKFESCRARLELSPDYPVQTERLWLRPLSEDDTDQLVAYRSSPEVARYVPFTPMDHTAVIERINGVWSPTAITGPAQFLTLGAELKDTQHLIGDVLLAYTSEEHRSGEVGWVLNPEFQGHGYATEAAEAVLRMGFEELGLHRIMARVDARNEPSLRVCKRLGMRQEAHLVENEWFKGEWSDEIDFAMLEHEWRERAARQSSSE